MEADASRVFSYRMEIDGSGVLRVAFDDVPGENRHVDKKAKLSDKAKKRILEILEKPGFAALEDEYVGSSVEEEKSGRSSEALTSSPPNVHADGSAVSTAGGGGSGTATFFWRAASARGAAAAQRAFRAVSLSLKISGERSMTMVGCI